MIIVDIENGALFRKGCQVLQPQEQAYVSFLLIQKSP